MDKASTTVPLATSERNPLYHQIHDMESDITNAEQIIQGLLDLAFELGQVEHGTNADVRIPVSTVDAFASTLHDKLKSIRSQWDALHRAAGGNREFPPSPYTPVNRVPVS